jgi:polyhydroxybutyrate depolymerase
MGNRRLVLLVALGHVGGCTDDDAGETGAGTTDAATTSSGSGTSAATTTGATDSAGGSTGGSTTGAVDPNCPESSLEPGLHKLTLTHDGLERAYDLYIPASYTGTQAAPLVLNLHPLSLGGLLHNIWANMSKMNDKADEAGFIVVQPDGTGSPVSWNAGDACCEPANSDDVDDVGFMKAIAAEVATLACIDDRRIYAMGMSNGGYLSHRLACEESDFVAAIGPVVASLSPELQCDLTRAVPVMQISGSLDNGAVNTVSFESWRDMNGCTDAAEQTYNKGAAVCMTHDECDDGVEVTHCVIEGGGHCFFGNSVSQSPGCEATEDIHSPDILWEFMSRWSLD